MRIGDLSRRTGVPASTLRYYETEGLLEPTERTEAGYRIYDKCAASRVLLIRRAQRVGLTLSDIRALVMPEVNAAGTGIAAIAENRLFEIERRLTSLLIQRHELAALVQDLESGNREGETRKLSELFSKVCRMGEGPLMPWESFFELARRLDCALSSEAAAATVARLREQHYHVWEEGDQYRILAVAASQSVREALSDLVGLEASCSVHEAPTVHEHEQGTLLAARGESAFLYATLFLSLDESVSGDANAKAAFWGSGR